jgi:hypothetical protein
MASSKEETTIVPTSTSVEAINNLVTNVNETLADSSLSTNKNTDDTTSDKKTKPVKDTNKEIIDVDKEGTTIDEPIDMCMSIPSTQTSVVEITNNVTNEIDNDYGRSWFFNHEKSLFELGDIDESKNLLMRSLFSSRTHISRELFYLDYVPFKSIDDLCFNNAWMTSELINCSMILLNIKAMINKTDNKYYFHSTYRYNFVMNPGYYDKDTIATSNKRGFKYPNDRNFFSYDKIFLPVNQGETHWTLVVIDVPNKIMFHYNSWIDEKLDPKVMTKMQSYIQYEYNQCQKLLDDEDTWGTVMTNENETEVPQQDKTRGDCGLFVISYAETISQLKDISESNQQVIDDSNLRRKLSYLYLSVTKAFVNNLIQPSNYSKNIKSIPENTELLKDETHETTLHKQESIEQKDNEIENDSVMISKENVTDCDTDTVSY